ncbi:RES family NAD+ phosphorylase [Ectopseudomonas mendocina]|uniref:RES family NAD+ phosphorylase n=1 Tax=Ectopseudomonas mendocina TaxID=300 RepID=A0ABZ2RNZ2_ECTME
MVKLSHLPVLGKTEVRGYRLINSKFPPTSLFDDVASAEDFDVLYMAQALTNPRIQVELGNLSLIPREEIPFGIKGCNYATGPFTHVNPDGSRFSDGRFGVLYIADELETAIAEVSYHQTLYWPQVPDLHYDRFVFRGLRCTFNQGGMLDLSAVPLSDAIYSPDDYSASRGVGIKAREEGVPGLRYCSVRRVGQLCWALMTPRCVTEVIQTAHFEMVWNKRITQISKLSAFK